MNDLKKMNDVYKTINLRDFYNTDYCDYAIYRALQRIPHLIDGFAQTQRKVIYTMIDKNIDKKTKVSDLAAIISLHTSYHHGSGSIESTITNLVPLYNNQVSLLREDGTYGNRSDRGAAASRYIETRLFKYSKVVFNQVDNTNFTKQQEVEGKTIEPAYMIPIVPLLLLNGQSQIGVGYASDILPRDVNVILQILKDILTGKLKHIPTNIPPIAPLFKGTITAHEKGGWEYKGIVKEVSLNTLHITEVPPRYTRDSYLNVLETLKDAGKIKSYVENINGDEFDIVIKMTPSVAWSKAKFTDKDARIKDATTLLKLVEKKSENITVINTKDEIMRYNNIAEIFFEYIVYVLGVYKKRKQFMLDKMVEDSAMNLEKIRFIKAVNDDIIILKNKKRLEINDKLVQMTFKTFDDSYDYLLNMRISNLTFEKVIELEKIISDADLDIKILTETGAAQIWLNDLEVFEKYLAKGE
jgi:DNA topoisomerase II